MDLATSQTHRLKDWCNQKMCIFKHEPNASQTAEFQWTPATNWHHHRQLDRFWNGIFQTWIQDSFVQDWDQDSEYFDLEMSQDKDRSPENSKSGLFLVRSSISRDDRQWHCLLELSADFLKFTAYTFHRRTTTQVSDISSFSKRQSRI